MRVTDGGRASEILDARRTEGREQGPNNKGSLPVRARDRRTADKERSDILVAQKQCTE